MDWIIDVSSIVVMVVAVIVMAGEVRRDPFYGDTPRGRPVYLTWAGLASIVGYNAARTSEEQKQDGGAEDRKQDGGGFFAALFGTRDPEDDDEERPRSWLRWFGRDDEEERRERERQEEFEQTLADLRGAEDRGRHFDMPAAALDNVEPIYERPQSPFGRNWSPRPDDHSYSMIASDHLGSGDDHPDEPRPSATAPEPWNDPNDPSSPLYNPWEHGQSTEQEDQRGWFDFGRSEEPWANDPSDPRHPDHQYWLDDLDRQRDPW